MHNIWMYFKVNTADLDDFDELNGIGIDIIHNNGFFGAFFL